MGENLKVENFSLRNDTEHFKKPPEMASELAQYLAHNGASREGQSNNEAHTEQMTKLKELLAQRYSAAKTQPLDITA